MEAEKEATSPYPLVPSNGYIRSDQQTASAPQAHDHELRKKKRMKCLIYVSVFAVFQVVVITVFALTVMRIKSPKFRVRSASLSGFKAGSSTTNPSFDFQMDVEFGVRNTNFGHFKYEDSIVVFKYKGDIIGQTNVDEARAKARSTRKEDASVELRSNGLPANSELGSDISKGVIPITVSSKLDGKIHLMKLIKKNKSAQMHCTMDINLADRSVQNIKCK